MFFILLLVLLVLVYFFMVMRKNDPIPEETFPTKTLAELLTQLGKEFIYQS